MNIPQCIPLISFMFLSAGLVLTHAVRNCCGVSFTQFHLLSVVLWIVSNRISVLDLCMDFYFLLIGHEAIVGLAVLLINFLLHYS